MEPSPPPFISASQTIAPPTESTPMEMDCKIPSSTPKNEELLERAALKGVPIFSGLDPESLRELSQMMEHCSYGEGDIIGGSADGDTRFHIITRGAVEFLTVAPDNDTMVLGRAGPGSYFGECEILSSDPDLLAVKASCPVETLALDRAEFEEFIRRKPEAALEVAKVLTERMTSAHSALHHHASQNVNELHDDQLSFGERIADRIASTMGSWRFIIGQSVLLGLWVTANCVAAMNHWDPYPFIALNLLLSCQAAFAAPIIMMSQNRQAAKDRISADVDHRVNVKCEENVASVLERLEAMERKIDGLSSKRKK